MLTCIQNLLRITSKLILLGGIFLAGCRSDNPTKRDPPYALRDSFDRLEGRDTKFWPGQMNPRDSELLDLLAPIYEKLQHLQYQPQAISKIPNVLHFIWLGPKNFPPQSVKYVRSWLAHHPGWKVVFWTDRDRQPPCSAMEVRNIANFSWSKLKHYYDGSLNWGEKSDYLRYEILAQEGGVYVDHDFYCCHSIDKLIQNFDFFCGLELPHHLVQGRAITPCNALLGTTPNHEILNAVLQCVEQAWSLAPTKFCESRCSEFDLVMNRSYMPLTHAILSTIATAKGANIVFPAAYFYSKEPVPTVYSKHIYATTWALSQTEQLTQQTYVRSKNIFKKNINYKIRLIYLLSINGVLAIIQLVCAQKFRKQSR